MTDIDFGTLITAVVDEMNCTTSELFGDELTDPDLAVKRYNRNVIGRIREVFDEAEAPAPVPPTCSNCGMVLGETARFCSRCGTPLSVDAADELLADRLAKDVGTTPDNPSFRVALARIREEMPEEWAALVQKITVSAKV
ncbi:MAG: zinc ribbon domain-containing protein [Methanomicrobiales archaeon]|jgi:hypothetical protein|nr:zinc ribbon domain-containing protein [Methanomicrobiales archaeon]